MSDFCKSVSLILIRHVENVTDEKESVGSVALLGQFLDFSDAYKARLMFATECNHHDRLVLMSVEPEKAECIVDILVVVQEDLN